MPSSTPNGSASHARRHLAAAFCAISFLVVASIGGTWWGQRVERAAFLGLQPLFADTRKHPERDHSQLALLEHLKNQAVALQRHAFERPDMLPLYGSSELLKPIPDKASIFFSRFPTGFTVFPVGKAGTTSLIILEKIAAVGEAAQGKRVAISLSTQWFFPQPNPDRLYAGNFSSQQTFAALLSPALSPGLKRDFARRVLDHRATLEQEPLLRFLTRHLAIGQPLDRICCAVVQPLARLTEAIYTAQDHFENALFIAFSRDDLTQPPARVPAQLNWERLLAQAAAESPPSLEGRPGRLNFGHQDFTDEGYRDAVAHAREWSDLALLLRALHEMRIKPLVLCMPPNGIYLEHGGVTPETLDLFAAKLRALAARYGAQCELFEDHREDINFLSDFHDHLSAKGWMYYNRRLDEFYHADPAQLDAALAKEADQRAAPASAPAAGAIIQ